MPAHLLWKTFEHTWQDVLALLYLVVIPHFAQYLVLQGLQCQTDSGLARRCSCSLIVKLVHDGWYQRSHLSQSILSSLSTLNFLVHLLQYLTMHESHLQGLYGLVLCCFISTSERSAHFQWYFFYICHSLCGHLQQSQHHKGYN